MKKLERDSLLADLAMVNSILATLPETDFLGRISFEGRKEEIERELAELKTEPDTLATIALFFHGDPVVGSRAIDSEFAAKALERYQEIIAKKLAASQTGGLAQRGPIPSRRAARLNITDIVRGSFGFLLQEDAADSPQLFKSSLREATEEVTDILGRFSSPRDEDYDAAIEDIDERLFSAVRQFFKVLHDDGATLRVVEGEQDKQFGRDAVERAHRRVEDTNIEETDLPIEGVLIGVIPIARRFEFRTLESGDIISGKVGPLLTREYLERIEKHEEMIGKQWLAIIRRRTVHRPGRQPLLTHTLLDLRELGDTTLIAPATAD
jgi:hypothetical protein